jgi:hypothetical protein
LKMNILVFPRNADMVRWLRGSFSGADG